MYSFRRLALLLALASPVIPVLQAQSPTSSSTFADASQQAPAATPGQTQTQPQGQTQTQPQISVAARIKARREQRRAAAIHEVYDHLYEVYIGAGYLRFTPGPTLQRVNEYDWNVGFTRYFNERLGATIDGRGYYGTPFIRPNLSGITKPAISEYGVLIGPTYRFYLQPKYSVSGRVMAGYAQGNFTADTNGFGSSVLGLYPDGSTFAVTGSIFGEYNLTPNVGFRVAPEYYLTGFGSKAQNSLGYNIGIVYRFGKQ
jgi:hypothetical protein